MKMVRSKQKFSWSGGYKSGRKQFLAKFTTRRLSERSSPIQNVPYPVNVSDFAGHSESNICPVDTIECVENTEIVSNQTSDSEQIPGEAIELDTMDHEIHYSKEISDRKSEFDIKQFQTTLAAWAVAHQIKHDQLRGLLKVWNESVPLPELPADPRTVMTTPRSIHLHNENYWHYGLKKVLNKVLERFENVPEKLSLKINCDGIPISKSSNLECWPILFEIKEIPKLSPCIVGVHCASSMI